MAHVLYSNEAHGIMSATIIKSVDPSVILCKSGFNKPPDMLPANSKLYIIGMFYPKYILKRLSFNHELYIYSNATMMIDSCNELLNEGVGIKGIRDPYEAPVLSIWKDLLSNKPIPLAVELMNDYHTWTFDLEDTLVFYLGLKEYLHTGNEIRNKTLPLVSDLIINNDKLLLKMLCATGKSISKYEEVLNDELCADLAYFTTLEGKSALAINTRQSSRLLTNHRNADNVDMFICYEYTGSNYKVSLYSNDNKVNVLPIARLYKGGGHNSVASFNCTELPFTQGIIKRNPAFDDMDHNYNKAYIKSKLIKDQSFCVKKYSHNREVKTAMINHFYDCVWGAQAICINTYSQDIDVYYPLDHRNIEIGISYIYTNTGEYRYTVFNLGLTDHLTKLQHQLGGELHPHLIFYASTNMIM